MNIQWQKFGENPPGNVIDIAKTATRTDDIKHRYNVSRSEYRRQAEAQKGSARHGQIFYPAGATP